MKTDDTVSGAHLGVVITGGSSGLGYWLARSFLEHGDSVVICARNPEKLEKSVASLEFQVPGAQISGMVCDVGDPGMVAAFARYASGKLVRIDRWINNAGTAGMMKRPLWELEPDDISETCSTNLSGSLLLCREALKVMQGQPERDQPVYHIFNFGFSLTGFSFSRSNIPHRISKRAVALLTTLLSDELKRAGNTSIGIHEISPGLVLTPLLTRDANEETMRFLMRAARRPEEAAALLVPKIRSISGRCRRVTLMPLPLLMLSLLGAVLWRKDG